MEQLGWLKANESLMLMHRRVCLPTPLHYVGRSHPPNSRASIDLTFAFSLPLSLERLPDTLEVHAIGQSQD